MKTTALDYHNGQSTYSSLLILTRFANRNHFHLPKALPPSPPAPVWMKVPLSHSNPRAPWSAPTNPAHSLGGGPFSAGASHFSTCSMSALFTISAYTHLLTYTHPGSYFLLFLMKSSSSYELPTALGAGALLHQQSQRFIFSSLFFCSPTPNPATETQVKSQKRKPVLLIFLLPKQTNRPKKWGLMLLQKNAYSLTFVNEKVVHRDTCGDKGLLIALNPPLRHSQTISILAPLRSTTPKRTD